MISAETITAATRKFVASLQKTRVRREEGLFVLEGTRAVVDSAACFAVRHLFATRAWLDSFESSLPEGLPRPVVVKPDDLQRMSSLTTPQGVLAVCEIPADSLEFPDAASADPGELVLALDRVQDPGNLGTIMRIADWFGISRILAADGTVDVYNPKTIQATMGAIARVRVSYGDLRGYLDSLPEDIPVYGTFLDGSDIYEADLTEGGIIVMGNEGNGISDEVGSKVDRRIKIPSFPPDRPTVESLNVSMATAITVAEFRRRAARRP